MLVSFSSSQNHKVVSYDAIGNITYKSDGGSYSYPAAGQARPRAVGNISGTVNGVANPSFQNGAITGAFGYLFNDLAHDWAKQGAVAGGIAGAGTVATAEGVCVVGTGGACALDAPLVPAAIAAGAAGGATIGYAVGYGVGAVADQIESVVVHGNAANSMSGTEVYYLINNATGAIDRIGITSKGERRYVQSFYQNENVTYVPQAYYQWRYPAMVDENIRLTWYKIEHGKYPRLNVTDR